MPIIGSGAAFCFPIGKICSSQLLLLRDFDRVLDLYEQKKPFYLFTGRGPSSESMHLGHLLPFIICKYFQDVFDCHFVIQMSDDEKFIVKDLTVDQVKQFCRDNIRDIIAMGFNPEKTFIFSDIEYMGRMYETTLRVQKAMSFNQAAKVFGLTEADSIGKVAYPATQISPCNPGIFPHIFPSNQESIPCLIPCGIDQDPYFRVARDIASKLGFQKPISIYSVFFPALQGFDSKMSASAENTAIFCSDSPAKVQAKITKYAFSGGGATLEEHKAKGGNPDVDIPFQYLRFFLEDDEELERLEASYRRGTLLTSEMKNRCAEVIIQFLSEYQERLSKVTPEVVERFMRYPGRQP